MRVVVYEYADDGRFAFEISDDGAEFKEAWAGQRDTKRRLCAFMDLGCDNNAEGMERLLAAMKWCAKEIKARKQGQMV